MGALGRLTRFALPTGRVGMAVWAWRHRDKIGDWAGFAARAAARVAEGSTGDVVAEARLRVKLTADARTRTAEGLELEVRDGVATVGGTVSGPIADRVVGLARETPGVERVVDLTERPRERRFAGLRT